MSQIKRSTGAATVVAPRPKASGAPAAATASEPTPLPRRPAARSFGPLTTAERKALLSFDSLGPNPFRRDW